MGSNAKTDVAAAAWATPRAGSRLLLATTTPNFSFNLPNSKNNCQDGRVQDQTELPRGLRGVDQQADQHGILCLVRLSLHELLLQQRRPRGEEGSSSRTSPSPPPWIGGLRLKPWKLRLSSRRRSTRAFSTCTRWPEIRATDISATSLSPSTWQSRWRASRPSAT